MSKEKNRSKRIRLEITPQYPASPAIISKSRVLHGPKQCGSFARDMSLGAEKLRVLSGRMTGRFTVDRRKGGVNGDGRSLIRRIVEILEEGEGEGETAALKHIFQTGELE